MCWIISTLIGLPIAFYLRKKYNWPIWRAVIGGAVCIYLLGIIGTSVFDWAIENNLFQTNSVPTVVAPTASSPTDNRSTKSRPTYTTTEVKAVDKVTNTPIPLFYACSKVAVLNVRQSPGTDFPVVGTLKRGECSVISGVSRDEQWAKIENGWVHKGYIEIKSSSE